MNTTWQLQEAKNRFSEVVEAAQKLGPQVITRRGVETAILLSTSDYKALTQREQSLVEFFRSSPLVGDNLGDNIRIYQILQNCIDSRIGLLSRVRSISSPTNGELLKNSTRDCSR